MQILPVVLNIRHYSARLEFFRSLAEAAQPPKVQIYPALKTCKALSKQACYFYS